MALNETGSSLVRHDGDEPQQHERQYLVEGVQGAPLQPLGYGGPRVAEPELLQDVVHAVRLYRLTGPR